MRVNLNNNSQNCYFGAKINCPKNVLSHKELHLLDKYKTQYNYCDTKSVQWKTKRAMDVALSTIGGLLSAPIMLLSAIAIKMNSKGPVIFKQERIGKDGKTFVIYKFRTMTHNCSQNKSVQNPDDDRITKVGKVLRKYSLDELPQLYNVIKGDMSLTGPRPLTLREHIHRRKNDKDFVMRYVFKPGAYLNYKCTHYVGDNPSINSTTEKNYIKDWNLKKDFKTYYKTLLKIIRGDNY